MGLKAEYVDHMGDDLAVVNAARVSFAKEVSEFRDQDAKLIKFLAKHDHWCYDDKTEVFTEEGWKLFDELREGEKVAEVFGWEENQFNFKFTTPEKIHKTWYEGDMIELDQNQLNYCVTPRHRMLIDERSSKGWKNKWFVKTSDDSFLEEKRLRTKAGWVGIENEKENYWEGYLYGFLLGDGIKKNNPTSYVRVKKEVKIEKLKECLDELKIEWYKKQDSQGVTNFVIKDERPLYDENKVKYLNYSYCMSMGINFCRGVFQGLLDSDGSVKRNTHTFSNSSRSVVEGFINLATLLGHNPIENKSRHLDNVNHNENYRVMLQTKDYAIVNDSRKDDSRKERIVEYKGHVHCVSVPSGMLLVRRKGTQMVCGNTPFGHTAIKLRMAAPIPIRTQCFKHKIGLVENEESRRYINSEPEIYIPTFRKAAEDKKQGSGEEFTGKEQENLQQFYKGRTDNLVRDYKALLAQGVCEEQARFILPQGAVVNWIWTGNLVSFANFVNKRTASDAQGEVQELANAVKELIKPLFPVSWEALTENK